MTAITASCTIDMLIVFSCLMLWGGGGAVVVCLFDRKVKDCNSLMITEK